MIMGEEMNEEQLKNMIKRHEGFRDHVYIDSVGIPTGGYGHAFLNRSPLPQEVCDILFEWDFKIAQKDCQILIDRHGLELNDVRRAVLTDMLFNMGIVRVSGFKKMLSAMASGFWGIAANEMLDSKWARQVGKRSTYLAELMRKGEV